MNKKVLIIGPIPPPYNGQSVATYQIYNLLKKKYKVYLINIGNLNRTGKSGKFSIKRILKTFKYYLKFCKIIGKVNYTYLTISQSQLGLLANIFYILVSKSFKKKIIVHLHGGKLPYLLVSNNSYLNGLFKLVLNKTNLMIVLSEEIKNEMQKFYLQNIEVLPNSINSSLTLSKQELKNKKRRFRYNNEIGLIYLSNMIKEKGYFDLLKICKNLIYKNIKIKVNFYGGWVNDNEKKDFFSFVNKYKIKNNIKYGGIIVDADKRKALLDSSIFILPTYYRNEGLPISIIEAMGMGNIVISTDYRAIPSLISKENGFLVKINCIDTIEDIVERICLNRNKYLSIIDNNVSKVKKYYTINKFESRLIEIFDGLD